MMAILRAALAFAAFLAIIDAARSRSRAFHERRQQHKKQRQTVIDAGIDPKLVKRPLKLPVHPETSSPADVFMFR